MTRWIETLYLFFLNSWRHCNVSWSRKRTYLHFHSKSLIEPIFKNLSLQEKVSSFLHLPQSVLPRFRSCLYTATTMADLNPRIEISFLETFICSAFAACFAEVYIYISSARWSFSLLAFSLDLIQRRAFADWKSESLVS